MKIIISGGGTGGHIFPAISIANTIKVRHPEAHILFVGAENRMEMSRVPEAGYEIIGLPISGFNRKNIFKNFKALYLLLKSLRLARKILSNFKPDAVVGVGGYASGPTLMVANQLGIPTLIQEQNSYAGMTNKLLAKKAAKICVAYEGMDAFFPKDKIVLTGNPVRNNFKCSKEKRNEAIAEFQLDPDKKTILVIGGSLGARTINDSMIHDWEKWSKAANVQIIWQSGKVYFNLCAFKIALRDAAPVKLYAFISQMDLAYSVADIIISRAGAGTISELCLVGKPVILIPSPNVAADHQTKNAMSLVNNKAAIMIPDKSARGKLADTILALAQNEKKQKKLGRKISKLALPYAADNIVNEIEKMIMK